MLSGHGLALGAALLWSVNFALLKVARGAGLGPLALTAGRFEVAGMLIVLLWVFFRRPRWRSFGWRGWAVVGVMAVVVGPIYQVLLAYAAKGTSAGLIGLLIATQSLHVPWLAKLLLGERFGWRKGLALGIAFAGLSLPILFKSQLAYEALIYPVLIGFCGVVGSLNTVLPRMVHRHVESFDLATTMLGVAAILCLPMLTPGSIHEYRELSFRGWAAVIWLGSAGHLGAFLLWYAALRKLSAVSTGFYLFVMMLGSMFWGWALLREPMNWTYGAAAVAVLIGLWLNAPGSKKQEQVIIASQEG